MEDAMKKLFLFLIFVYFVLIGSSVQAAFIDLRIDGDIMTFDGEAYDPEGTEISLEVWIMPDEGDTVLNNYAFDIWYDATESITYTGGENTLPSGWFTMSNEVLIDEESYVAYIEGFTFGSGVSLDNGVLVATLDFNFDDASLVEDFVADFSIYYSEGTAQGVTINDNLIADQPTSIGPDLTAVPIPGAAFLFGSSLLAMLGFRRKK